MSVSFKPRTLLSVAALCVGLIVAACGGNSDVGITCPAIRIPLDTERVTRFAPGDGRDITDIELKAEVGFLSGECTVDEDEIEMVFPVVVRGRRGPAEKDGFEEISVFLAVSDRDRNILSRRELPFRLEFTGNRAEVVMQDTITIAIPKKPEQSSGDFLVFLGFNLSREELRFNNQERRN